MTEVPPIAALLSATPLADPLAAATLPNADQTDPFAELLAVLVASPTVAPTIAAVDLPVAAAPTDPASPTGDSEASDAPASDDGTVDDELAASLSAMLAIAPQPPAPPPVVLAVALPAAPPPAPTRSAEPPETPVPTVAETTAAGKTMRKAPAATTEIPVPTETNGPALTAPPSKADGPSAPDLPAQAATTAQTSSDEPDDAPVAARDAVPVRPAAASTLPAAILRMLREAPAAPAQPTAPVTRADPRDATIPTTQPAASARANAAIGNAGTDSPRREVRTTTMRATTAASSRPASPKPTRAVADTRPIPTDPVAILFTETRAPAPVADAPSGPSAVPVDSLVQSQLAIGRDGQWLDSLARDIAASADGGDLHFKLQPENLGALTVSIAAMADGAAIRMTADTDRAHQILTEAQPKLIAEARAQGLRVSESHVELNNGSNGGGNATPGSGSGLWGQTGGQAHQQSDRRQQTSSPNRLPFQPSNGDEAAGAPARRTSERYA